MTTVVLEGWAAGCERIGGGRIHPLRPSSLFRLLPQKSAGAEISVHRGDLSAALLRELRLRRLHLIDPWQYVPSRATSWYGGPVGRSQPNIDRRYRGVVARFSSEIANGIVTVHRGASWDMADRIADDSLDWVYIDGDHSYEAVTRDIATYRAKVKPMEYWRGTTMGCRGGGGRTESHARSTTFIRQTDVEILELGNDWQWAWSCRTSDVRGGRMAPRPPLTQRCRSCLRYIPSRWFEGSRSSSLARAEDSSSSLFEHSWRTSRLYLPPQGPPFLSSEAYARRFGRASSRNLQESRRGTVGVRLAVVCMAPIGVTVR